MLDEPPREEALRRVDELLRDRDELLELRDREELLRRELPPVLVAVFAACWADFVACSKSFRRALPNFVVSRRASVMNLPSPL